MDGLMQKKTRTKLSLRRKKDPQPSTSHFSPPPSPPPLPSLPSSEPTQEPSDQPLTTSSSSHLPTQCSVDVQRCALDNIPVDLSEASAPVTHAGALELKQESIPVCARASVSHTLIGDDGKSGMTIYPQPVMTGGDEEIKSSKSSAASAVNMGDGDLCQMCQMDLSCYDTAEREQHVDACSDKVGEAMDTASDTSGDKENNTASDCPLCRKIFRSREVMLTHSKSCAKVHGINTVTLIDIIREAKHDEMGATSCSTTEEVRDKGEGYAGSGTGESSAIDDFKKPPPQSKRGRGRRKRGRSRHQDGGYIGMLEDEQLQLALALSASIDPQQSADAELLVEEGSRKRPKRCKKDKVLPTLLTTSASQAESIISERAEQIITAAKTEDEGIPCTPAFGASKLAETVKSKSCEEEDTDDYVQQLLGGEERGSGGGGREGEGERGRGGGERGGEGGVEGGVEERGGGEEGREGERGEREGRGGGGEMNIPSTEGTTEQDMKEMEVEEEEVRADQREAEEESTTCRDSIQNDEALIVPSSKCKLVKEAVVPSLGQEKQGYQTLWQLSSYREIEDRRNFYVPALSHTVTPTKDPLHRNTCENDSGLCVTFPKSDEQIPPLDESTSNSRVRLNASSETSGIQRLLADLHGLVGSTLLSDVVITTQSHSEVPAHAAILAARCPTLVKVFTSDSGSRPFQLDLSQHDDETVFAFLEYVYTGESTLLKENTVQLKFLLLAKELSLEEFSDGVPLPSNAATGGTPQNTVPAGVPVPAVTHEPTRDETESQNSSKCDTETCLQVDSSLKSEHSTPQVGILLESIPPLHLPELEEDKPSLELQPGSPELISSASVSPTSASPPLISFKCGSSPPVSVPACLSAPSPSKSFPGETGISLQNSQAKQPISVITVSSSGESSPQEPMDGRTAICVSPSPLPHSHTAVEVVEKSDMQSDATRLASCSYDTSCATSVCVDGDTKHGTVSARQTQDSNASLSPSHSSQCSNSGSPVYGTEGVAGCGTGREISFEFNDTLGWDDEVCVLLNEDNPNRQVEGGQVLLHGSSHNVLSRPLQAALTPVALSVTSSEAHQNKAVYTTPAGSCVLLESDNITPMPEYHGMQTPALKMQCSRFGIKPLPKKKMITKLQEIYDYTHPLVDEAGKIVQASPPSPSSKRGRRKQLSPVNKERGSKNVSKKRTTKKDMVTETGSSSSQPPRDLAEKVREFISTDQELYQDILLYKPLELTFIQARLKAAEITISKDKLSEILDFLCVTYTVPRPEKTTRKR